MSIPLKLADETTPVPAPEGPYPPPAYEPWPTVEAEPLGYAGLGVATMPLRTNRQIAWDVTCGIFRRVATGIGLLLRVLPLTLALIAYVLLGAGRAVTMTLTGVARAILWTAGLRPLRAVSVARARLADRRVPLAEAVA